MTHHNMLGSCQRSIYPLYADTFTSMLAGQAVFNSRLFDLSTGWIFVQHLIGSAGTYRLEFYAQDVGDTIGDTALAMDDILIGSASTVPEPVTLVLLGTGLGGVLVARRRRARAVT
jgi:hypothetical protein